MNFCTVEIWCNGWRTAGTVRLLTEPDLGMAGRAVFEYDDDYAFEYLGATDAHAVSCRYPVRLGDWQEPNWPPFLLDLIPAGAGRRFWEQSLGLPNNRTSDWQLLVHGAMNPLGNFRIKEAVGDLVVVEHDGFSREDVLLKDQDFLAYAQHNGVAIGGSSGAQGDAPKMLLTEDYRGRWHPAGTVPTNLIQQEWLVKMPRGLHERDLAILKAEASYYRIATLAGLNTAGPVTWDSDCLFVPRFDLCRDETGMPVRLGMESLASAMGIAAFGVPVALREMVTAIRRHSTRPMVDVCEFIARDVLNVAMGNTDNHARNQALLKTAGGVVRLSPLYDFAPMFADPAGIPRVASWGRGLESDGYPDWNGVINLIGEDEEERSALTNRLIALLPSLETVAEQLAADGVDPFIVAQCDRRCTQVCKDLERLKDEAE